MEPNAITTIFGISQVPRSRLQADLMVFCFCSTVGQRLILVRWESPTPPFYALWIKEALNNLQLEKIWYTLNGSSTKFKKVWGPFFHVAEKIIFPTVPE